MTNIILRYKTRILLSNNASIIDRWEFYFSTFVIFQSHKNKGQLRSHKMLQNKIRFVSFEVRIWISQKEWLHIVSIFEKHKLVIFETLELQTIAFKATVYSLNVGRNN